MRPLHALVLPIRPIQILAEQRQREYVRQLFLDHVMLIATIQIGESDVIQSCVGPVDVVGEIVDRERVWPAEVVSDDRSPRAPVHSEAPDVGVVAPVRVEDEAAERVNHEGARLLQPAPYQHLENITVQLCVCVGRNLCICDIHGSRCAIYGSILCAEIHGLRRNLWIAQGSIYRSTGSLSRPYLNLTFMN